MRLSVLALNSDVLCYNLLEFLSMREIVRLESVFACNKEAHRILTERLRLFSYAGTESLVFTNGSAAMNWFLQRQVQLASLSFGLEVRDESIIRFSEMFRSLKSISWNGSYITDLAVSVVVKFCPGLQAMKLTKCYNITDAAMVAISQHALDLRTFHLTYNCEVTSVGFSSVLRKCSKLAHLGLSCCRKLDGTILEEIATHCAKLQTLSIGNVREVTEAHLTAFQGRCPHIKTIDFQPMPSISGNALATLAEQYTDLQTLRLHQFGMKDPSLKRIVTKCTQLKTLYLAGCRNITDAGVLVVALSCPLLEEIDLSRCKRITDESPVALAERCPRLTSVSLSHCPHVTDTGVSALSRHCPHMKALHLSKCNFICERTLIAAINRCRSLTSLELGGSRVSTNVVVAIAAQCSGLAVLTLEGCNQISYWCLRAVCHFLGGLQVLQLLDIDWVTNEHIVLIAESCPDLVTLGLTCKSAGRRFVLSATAMETLAHHCRKLSYLGTCECSSGAWQVATVFAAASANRGIYLELQLTPLSPTPLSSLRTFLHW